jgi:formate C-acetyltransferase
MELWKRLIKAGEYCAAGAYENPERGLFFRKSVAIKRFYEKCPLPNYEGKPLYPSGKICRDTLIAPRYLTGLSTFWSEECSEDETLMLKEFEKDFKQSFSSVPVEHTVAGNMWTHSIPHYERILREGFSSYLPRIEKIQDEDIRDGLKEVVSGIEIYANRCVEYLQSVRADERLINALKLVPMQPAQDIYQALVGWNFILYLDTCDNIGCLSEGLKPYYNGEDVTEVIANLYENLDVNEAWSASLIGDNHPLVLQCLEASKGKRRPMLELLVDENTPETVWEKSFEVMKTMNGQPAFYNKKLIYEALQKRFPQITATDLKQFSGGGCTETMIAGYSCVGSLDAGINLLFVLEETLREYLTKVETFEEFYLTYMQKVEAVVEKVTTEISNSQLLRAKVNPLPMRTLLIDDCIDNGMDYNNGGARYKWSIISFAGLVNVIDSLIVTRDFVFEKKLYTKELFLEKLKANDEEFLKQARSYEIAYGNDDARADELASRLSKDVFATLDDKKPAIGDGFIPASILFNYSAAGGRSVGATPDGRTANSPLADSVAAIFQKDVNGPLALLNSVTSLDLSSAIGIPVLNFNVQPDFDVYVLKNLISGYIEKGGMQMQLSCVSKEMLLEAYKNPDKYKKIVVRVAGFSEYFYRLSDDMKKVVLNRTIQEWNE